MDVKKKLRERIKDFSKSEFNSDFDSLKHDQRSDVWHSPKPVDTFHSAV